MTGAPTLVGTNHLISLGRDGGGVGDQTVAATVIICQGRFLGTGHLRHRRDGRVEPPTVQARRPPPPRPGSLQIVRYSAAAATLALCLAGALGPAAQASAGPPTRHELAPCGPEITDPLAEPPWPLTRLRPDLAWPLTRGAGVTVAVIDSGVSADHPALAGQVLPGADYVLPSGGLGDCDENGHGTLIAGIIAGRQTASSGYRFSGMAPDAKIVPVRVLRDQRRSFEADLSNRIATAIRWVVDARGAGVINLSLTTPPTPQLFAAIQYALSKRAVVVAAAGNEGDSTQSGQPSYPAAYDGVIAVAGVDSHDERVSSSTAGDYVDVAAPGESIAGPSPAGGGYLFSKEGGTSFAAAYVSGVAALIRAYDPSLLPGQVGQRIMETADHPAEIWNPGVGYGVVNPRQAVGALRLPPSAGRVAAPRVEPPPPRVDQLRAVTVAAGWVAAGGAAASMLVLLGVPVVRRGRRRGWRSGPI
jgi:type VII secretion-associated serine protease mycosin